jgi:membrane-associated protease RseP (regulator of RpoE activity)
LYWTGYILVDYGDLKKAQTRLEQVLKLTERETHEEFGGLGLRLEQENGRIRVVAPTENSPAARAGIDSGDIIAAVDGENVQGWSLDQAVNKMRGVPNTAVILRVVHGPDEAPRDMRLTRATIQVYWSPYQRHAALWGLGDINFKRGDLNSALNSYNAGLAIVERLAKSDPSNAGWQRELSVSDNRIGDVQTA